MANPTKFIKYGGWLPSHPEIHTSFLAKHVKLAKRAVLDSAAEHLPAVQEFKDAIEGDAIMKSLFDQIFLQVSDKNTVPDFETLLYMLDNILPSAPPYHIATDAEGNPIGEPIGVVVLDGTYYAVLPDDGAPADDPDLPPGSPYGAIIRSQAFLTISAARALIFIRADNSDIGLMCFVGIGMVEVSTCEVTVVEGQHVSTGDELGMFHFGGSTHALIFGPQVNVTFADNIKENEHIWVNSIIAQVKAAENKWEQQQVDGQSRCRGVNKA
ncbi:hypothetical protein FA95DRAFT_1573597 [Auriscalpium vulgare]|uniref:Uncharacterized protein n=1 Tax=Auriscalpium vulgare TaxID=40419 RepID=A0ACB8RPK1_9AGAM|nr:hypothetical protein FA95DRAFT_1573597 [Auriscalpium vulgare]